MRASEQEQTGGAGLSEVCGKFERIGWAPVINARHDLGTDVLVAARDDRRFDLGLYVGVQVKAGPSYFEDEERDENGGITGWWYYERDATHFDDWVTHCLPHLVVLHDLDRDVSYWVHVTPDQVRRTGKGCKILVSADQTIDLDNFDALLAVASSQNAAPVVEGTAFTASAERIAPGRRLRHALIVPRLIAPHRNRGYHEPVDPNEAVALIARGRFLDLIRFAERHDAVPDPAAENAPRDWRWMFVRALWAWTNEDALESLRKVSERAPAPSERAASTIVVACALATKEQPRAAIDLLDGLLEADELGPVDQAWTLVQRARFLAEIGEVVEASANAVAAQRFLIGDQDDLTASALAAAAAWLLFITADPDQERDLGQVLTASDTAVSWWRSQSIASAMDVVGDRVFRTWADDRSTRFVAEDLQASNLFAAEFNANITGDHGAWRAAAALAARQELARNHVAGTERGLADQLDALRRSGDEPGLKLAAAHLWRVGPVEPLVDAVARVAHADWAHTTARANFRLWSIAGDLMDETEAVDAATWCADLLRVDNDEFVNTVRPNFIIDLAAAEAVAGLLSAAPSAHRRVAQCIAALPTPTEPILRQELARAIQHLDIDGLAKDDIAALRRRSGDDAPEVGAAILGLLARHGDTDASDALVDRVTRGDLYALTALSDVTVLHSSAAESLIETFSNSVERTIDKAAASAYGIGRFDSGHSLALFNIWYPDVARWDPLLELLTHPKVAAGGKRGAYGILLRLVDRLPDDVREALARHTPAISVTGDSELHPGPSIGGMGIGVAIAVGALSRDEVPTALARLAVGSAQERQDVSAVLATDEGEPMRPLLASLIGDRNADVRSAAARAVGQLASASPDDLMLALAEHAISDVGCVLPLALMSGAAGTGAVRDEFKERVAGLREHRSARVRHSARWLLDH